MADFFALVFEILVGLDDLFDDFSRYRDYGAARFFQKRRNAHLAGQPDLQKRRRRCVFLERGLKQTPRDCHRRAPQGTLVVWQSSESKIRLKL